MIYELVDLFNWKKKKQILEELNENGSPMNEREFRQQVKEQNKLFYENKSDVFIAHSNKGYKATNNIDEILNSLRDNHKRAIDMLNEESKVKKILTDKKLI